MLVINLVGLVEIKAIWIFAYLINEKQGKEKLAQNTVTKKNNNNGTYKKNVHNDVLYDFLTSYSTWRRTIQSPSVG